MECSSCGASSEREGALCEKCQSAPAEVSDSEDNPSSRSSASLHSITTADFAPPRRKRKSTAEIRQLYRETLGSTDLEEFLGAFTNPVIIGLLSLFVWLLVSLVLMTAMPTLGIAWAFFVAAVLCVSMAYYGAYCNVLLGLFYADRIAFIYSLLGLVGVPFATLIYIEDIGHKKVFFAFGCYALMVIGAVTTLLTLEDLPPELLEVMFFIA